MRFVEFLNAVRRQTRERSECIGLDDPLLAVVSLIHDLPETPRAMVLHRVLSGLKDDQVQFKDSDVFALDADAIVLVDALVSDILTGRYTSADLQRAIHTATVRTGSSW
ncbi:MAG: hypothetical protein ACXV4B_05815 [Halobacteriota archaeon]